MNVYTDTSFTIYSYRRWSGKEIKQIGTAVNAVCQGNLSSCHRLASPGLVDVDCSSSEMSVTSTYMEAHSISLLASTVCQIIWYIQNWHALQSVILVQHSVGTSYRPQMKVVTFSGIRRQTSLPNRLDTACVREWGWELGLQNPSWVSQLSFCGFLLHSETSGATTLPS